MSRAQSAASSAFVFITTFIELLLLLHLFEPELARWSGHDAEAPADGYSQEPRLHAEAASESRGWIVTPRRTTGVRAPFAGSSS